LSSSPLLHDAAVQLLAYDVRYTLDCVAKPY
jgi:hypothetical protein